MYKILYDNRITHQFISDKYYRDIRPTFLFWARGKPVALLRGANRPLLTKLIRQEARIEMNLEHRFEDNEVDYSSSDIIQVFILSCKFQFSFNFLQTFFALLLV